jgi:polysaccharide deacetylase family protein (PEP-CTERM system associated)
MLHALSFDVEEYFQVHAYTGVIDPALWDEYPSRVEIGTRAILDLLAEATVSATFFTLGWVARRQPALMRDIVAAGHELASHGYNHRRVDSQTPDEFRRDVRAAKDVLEQIAGVSITAYRAPSFSINERTPLAHTILVEEGYTLNSSARQSTVPVSIATSSGTLTEFPVPDMSMMGRRIGVGGGGYFRLFPLAVTRRAISAAERAGRPFCVYLHPWEFDPDQPRITASLVTTWRQRIGLSRTARRLKQLLQSFQFGTLTKSLSQLRTALDGTTGPLGSIERVA